MTMTSTPQPIDRIIELEKEVKSLARLVKELVAKEKVTAKRLQMVAHDGSQTSKAVKALDSAAKKVDAKINSVHAQVQRRS